MFGGLCRFGIEIVVDLVMEVLAGTFYTYYYCITPTLLPFISLVALIILSTVETFLLLASLFRVSAVATDLYFQQRVLLLLFPFF